VKLPLITCAYLILKTCIKGKIKVEGSYEKLLNNPIFNSLTKTKKSNNSPLSNVIENEPINENHEKETDKLITKV
jgi:hypothetical protein